MANLSKGDRVRNIDNQEIGTIVEVQPPRRGSQLFIVDFNGKTDLYLESDLQPYTIHSDEFSYCKENQYGSYEDFLLVNTTLKIRNSNTNTISSLMASKTLFRPYQFKPLLKFLNSNNRKILVADEVGLGKTIEAGHIMLELKARGELGSVLIVCPKSLQDKWKSELKFKFGITFTIYENARDVIRDLEDRSESFKGIINYEKIRALKDEDKKQSSTYSKSKTKNIPSFVEHNRISLDLLVCDEAHKLRNNNTQTHKGLKKVVDLAKSAVFLTATPIMIKRENLYNLLNLLDSSLFYDISTFESSMEMNKPFVHALNALGKANVSLSEISDILQNEEITVSYVINDKIINLPAITTKELYAETPLYKKIIENLEREDTYELRSQLQYDISSMSLMNGIFSRTRKKDITTDWTQAERIHHTKDVKLHEQEKLFFDEQISEYIEDNSVVDLYDDIKMSPGKSLGLVQKKRRVASSVFASLNTVGDLDKGIDKYAEYPDAKIEKLIEIAEEVFKNTHKKLIVFALFKNTIKYLQIRLKKAGYSCVTIHGDVDMDERNKILTKFKNDPSIQILLSSEVGSEGLDMQFCDSMVNYDLPWNPMVVEQRIGRIDRFGQQSPTVNIYNIIVNDSIMEDIFVRLLDRIGMFKDTIGDLEAILDYKLETGEYKDKSISEMILLTEKELYCKNLTPEEIQRKGDAIAIAVENEKLHLTEIEEKLDNTLTNDVYFKNEINRIRKRNAYVSEIELRNYVSMLIRKTSLSTCGLVQIDDNLTKITIPLSDKGVLSKFIKTNIKKLNKDNFDYAKQYANSIADIKELEFTFNQEYAFNNQSVDYMNIYNPVIIAASEYFDEALSTNKDRSKTYRFKVNGSQLSLKQGRYFLVTYLYKISHTIYDKTKNSEKIMPILYSIEEGQIIENQDVVDSLFGIVQSTGYYCDPNDSILEEDLIEDAKIAIVKARKQISNEQAEFYNIRMETDKQLKEQQTKKRFSVSIDNYQSYIDKLQDEYNSLQYQVPNESIEKRKRELDGALRLQRYNLINQENLLQEELEKIQRMSVSIDTPEMKALCFIKVE